MIVRELIAALQRVDPDLDVYAYTEDEKLLRPGQGTRFLSIEHVDASGVAFEGRDAEGEPLLRFDNSSSSVVALITVSTNA